MSYIFAHRRQHRTTDPIELTSTPSISNRIPFVSTQIGSLKPHSPAGQTPAPPQEPAQQTPASSSRNTPATKAPSTRPAATTTSLPHSPCPCNPHSPEKT